MQATKNGHEKIVHFLIEKGADMHWKSKVSIESMNDLHQFTPFYI